MFTIKGCQKRWNSQNTADKGKRYDTFCYKLLSAFDATQRRTSKSSFSLPPITMLHVKWSGTMLADKSDPRIPYI